MSNYPAKPIEEPSTLGDWTIQKEARGAHGQIVQFRISRPGEKGRNKQAQVILSPDELLDLADLLASEADDYEDSLEHESAS